MVEEQQLVKVTRRERNSDSESLDDGLIKEKKFAHELANASLPSYLKDLYINFSFPSGPTHPLNDQKIIAANTIRSYKNQASSMLHIYYYLIVINITYICMAFVYKGNPYSLVLADDSCGYYKFGMNEATMADGEEIIHAELRLLQKISMPGDYYEVNIYYLLNDNNIDSPLKLTFKHTDSTLGWKAFDVTPIVENWKHGWVNYGLKVTLTKGEQKLSCEGVYSSGEQEDILNTEPLLVVFTHDRKNKLLSDALQDSSATKHKKEKRQTTSSIQTSHVACHLKTMEVNNTAVAAGKVHLVIPKLFDVGVCVGHCPRLPVESLTDYASILSLHYYQTRGHAGAPKRCCVPTNFELIQMVFYNKLNCETIYKSVPAKATACDCI